MTSRDSLAYAVALSFVSVLTFAAPPQAPPGPTIASLTEPDEGLTVMHRSPQTGLPTFAASRGRGLLLAVPAAASAESRAMAFVNAYGSEFGLADINDVEVDRTSPVDEAGLEHVRMRQLHRGVPITAGELLVHLKGTRAMAVNGHTLSDLPNDVTPRLTPQEALAKAHNMLVKYMTRDIAAAATYSTPHLEILNRAFLTGTKRDHSHLAWFVEATGQAFHENIWIDAKGGGVLLHFSQLESALSRNVYTANHTGYLAPNPATTLLRSEGGAATGDLDSDNAYNFAGITYNYFKNNHGRDSWDGIGAQIVSTTHYCTTTCPSYANAFWTGAPDYQMVYGDGYASADDVVGHELTHAVTDKTAHLYYYMQSGALNESFSDIFGETIDLTDGVGNDSPAVRWQVGEELFVGGLRNMLHPELVDPKYGVSPAKMTDANFFCDSAGFTDPSGDHGGVHTNSGVPNKAYALMVDGGSFNGRTITGIGLTKAAKIEYRALTTYLTSGATFLDDYNALKQSCSDLIGVVGITSSDCVQVDNALLAVEMNIQPCGLVAGDITPLCSSGEPHLFRRQDFEGAVNDWTNVDALGHWYLANFSADSGVQSVWGEDPDGISDHKLQMTAAFNVPSGSKMYFDHEYEFENSVELFSDFVYRDVFWDGGVIEYSTNGGANWSDAGSLIEAGHGYDGVVNNYADFPATNALRGRAAFTGTSFGYLSTRLNLASLGAQNVLFRFRIGSDDQVGSLGWVIDNVTFYNCHVPNPFTDDPLVASSTRVKKIHFDELHTRINSLRTAHALAPYGWPALGKVLKSDVDIMRTKLADVYTAMGLPSPVYIDATLSANGTRVRTVQIDQLRSAVKTIE
jgi:bacillolysin